MKKLDGRKIKHSTREEMRIRSVRLVESGASPEQVIKGLGLHRSNIYVWLAKYREGGIEALKTRKITGAPSKLKGSHLQQLYKIITTMNPLQLEFDFALWTRDMIRQLIFRQFNVRLSVTSVGRLLRKLGLSPQKPLRRAYQQDEILVKKWVSEEYPSIKKLARKHKAEIFFGDESTVRSDYHSGTTWAPIGQTPVVKSTGARYSINLVSAISSKGAMRFMGIEGRMNSKKFILFLKRLIFKANHSIYLILDGHPVHKSKKVQQFVESTEGRLKLFYLPPYSPQLNPDEQVWNYLKHHNIGKKSFRKKDEMRRMVYLCLRSLQKLPEKIMNFFKEKNVRYAMYVSSGI